MGSINIDTILEKEMNATNPKNYYFNNTHYQPFLYAVKTITSISLPPTLLLKLTTFYGRQTVPPHAIITTLISVPFS